MTPVALCQSHTWINQSVTNVCHQQTHDVEKRAHRDHGLNHRKVLTPDGVEGYQSLPGGQSGVFFHPNYGSQLPLWLTNDYHPLAVTEEDADGVAVMEYTFGPVMPVKTYDKVTDAVDFINHRDRPLGLYYFGTDQAEEEHVLNHTTSGGVTVNDVVMHVAQEDLPFGGVGPSGMGAYHGLDGFKTFSHAKAVFTQTKLPIAEMAGLRPPYGEKLLKAVRQQMR